MTTRTTSRKKRYMRAAEAVLWAAGAISLAGWGAVALEARLYQAYESRQLNHLLQIGSASSRAAAPTPQFGDGAIMGRLEVSRINLSVLVLNRDDAGALLLGAGRLPGPARPGGAGNLVIAAHRDTFFRPLRDIRKGDRIDLTTPRGDYAYVVDWTAVVKEDDAAALAKSDEPLLTLVTCYPFQYIGPAPRRFIIRARLDTAAGH